MMKDKRFRAKLYSWVSIKVFQTSVKANATMSIGMMGSNSLGFLD